MSVRGLVGRGYALGQKFLHPKLAFVLKLCHLKKFFENLISFIPLPSREAKKLFFGQKSEKNFFTQFSMGIPKKLFLGHFELNCHS